MGGFFTRERFGRPQILAALMLLAFLAQCLWLVERGWRTGTVYPEEIYRLERGTALWKHRGLLVAAPHPETELELSLPPVHAAPGLENGSYDANHSSLWYLVASAALAVNPVPLRPENIRELHRLSAAPYLVFGLLLGASLWYVSAVFLKCRADTLHWLFTVSRRESRSAAIWSRAGTGAGQCWRHLHSHRRRTHVVRATRSDFVELATYCAWDCRWRLRLARVS
jgi:hypothetical protein